MNDAFYSLDDLLNLLTRMVESADDNGVVSLPFATNAIEEADLTAAYALQSFNNLRWLRTDYITRRHYWQMLPRTKAWYDDMMRNSAIEAAREAGDETA